MLADHSTRDYTYLQLWFPLWVPGELPAAIAPAIVGCDAGLAGAERSIINAASTPRRARQTQAVFAPQTIVAIGVGDPRDGPLKTNRREVEANIGRSSRPSKTISCLSKRDRPVKGRTINVVVVAGSRQQNRCREVEVGPRIPDPRRARHPCHSPDRPSDQVLEGT